MDNIEIKCKCGAAILDEDIDFSNKENEIGENCSEVSFICYECNDDVGTENWGHFEDLEEAKEYLKDYLNS